jgi:signal transduction histidine kinase/CheY-like chemotaxis protein
MESKRTPSMRHGIAHETEEVAVGPTTEAATRPDGGGSHLGPGVLLAALKGLKEGDCAVRLSVGDDGPGADVAEAFNEVAELVVAITAHVHEPCRPMDHETRPVELYARRAAESIDTTRLDRETQEADRRKGEFLAMLGHELRNPLAPILNALHVMRLPGVSPCEVDQARGVAERQVRHLARLVDDLLDVSRVSRGKIDLRKGRVDLRNSVCRAVETVRPLIEARHHELTLTLPEEPLDLVADAARIDQVLACLLSNAAKYTEPGGRINLAAARDGDEAVVRVCDNGIGIEPDLLPHVFELFTQADRSLDRSQGGLGIGLTLVHRLVELHGGRVTACSAGIGRGSEFLVYLPLATAGCSIHDTADPHPAPGRATFVTQPRRVLVVDDNIDAARILARLLSADGHRVDVAHDGRKALEIAQVCAPEVVLLDIGLPELNGYEVASRIRSLAGLERVVLVALTGYGQAADRIRASAAGFDHHLVKPVDLEVVRDLIARTWPSSQPTEFAR